MFRGFLKTWLVLMFGGLIGAGVMLVTAPMSGEETRQFLKDNYTNAQYKANAGLETAQRKARQISDIGRRVVEEQKSSLERGAEEVKSVAMSGEASTN